MERIGNRLPPQSAPTNGRMDVVGMPPETKPWLVLKFYGDGSMDFRFSPSEEPRMIANVHKVHSNAIVALEMVKGWAGEKLLVAEKNQATLNAALMDQAEDQAND